MSDMVEFNEKPYKGKQRDILYWQEALLTNENSHELANNMVSKH